MWFREISGDIKWYREISRDIWRNLPTAGVFSSIQREIRSWPLSVGIYALLINSWNRRRLVGLFSFVFFEISAIFLPRYIITNDINIEDNSSTCDSFYYLTKTTTPDLTALKNFNAMQCILSNIMFSENIAIIIWQKTLNLKQFAK